MTHLDSALAKLKQMSEHYTDAVHLSPQEAGAVLAALADYKFKPMMERVERQKKDIKILRDTLKLYADPFDYREATDPDLSIPDFYQEMNFGEHAQNALDCTWKEGR